MPGDANWTTRVDSTLKAQAEDILNELGMTMSGVFTMLLKQIVREKSVPLLTDLLEAQTARMNGFQGRNARDIVKDMRAAIAEVESDG